MTERPILNFLTMHAAKKTVSFHMPGHKGSAVYRRFGYAPFLDQIMDCDITEIPGADNLFQTEGILKTVQEEYAKLYGVKRSYLLINGTSGGVIAAIMASVSKGKKLIMARNSHKAAFNALVLADIQPVYAYPEMIHEYGVSGGIPVAEIERCIRKNPEAEAIILPSPNYYGICSNIQAIADVSHANGKILIVDQAHGAHLKFFGDAGFSDLPKSAEVAGADIIVNSIHKTLASFTQSAVLNLNSDRVDHYVLEDKLQMIQSTSPSYLLMASLDINADICDRHKKLVMTEWHDALLYFYAEARKIQGLVAIGNPYNAAAGVSLDITKINLDMSALGIDGAELEKLLMKRGIFAELTTGNILMCMTGIGSTKRDMERLLAALEDISNEHACSSKAGMKSVSAVSEGLHGSEMTAHIAKCLSLCPATLHTVDRAGVTAIRGVQQKLDLFLVPKDKERIPLVAGAGRICASSIIPYPPGIPFVCPGEMLTGEVISYIQKLREAGEKVIGVNDYGEITVGRR
ncbi:MAG: aminotransferase class I/II-fold pyridoxal phosphate-dependent enzyme [Methanocalculaceae archaeon]|jgi:lysine decarboxylase|nr:aminotransferase class I/II-fold pyridoxal phosphate-dependent enzyme [Methanocalculaceae archaeon]